MQYRYASNISSITGTFVAVNGFVVLNLHPGSCIRIHTLVVGVARIMGVVWVGVFLCVCGVLGSIYVVPVKGRSVMVLPRPLCD